MRQQDLAERLRVSQATIARWENGKDTPAGTALIDIGRLAGDPEQWWWWELAGFTEHDRVTQLALNHMTRKDRGTVMVPLLKDPAAAGTPRAVDEKEISHYLEIPKQLASPGSGLFAVRVAGDSMSPIIEEGYIVCVATSDLDPAKLVNQMVAAREGDGITIKWLRKEKNHYLLVPQHTSLRNPVRIMEPDGEWSIVGRVVFWVGQPPPARR